MNLLLDKLQHTQPLNIFQDNSQAIPRKLQSIDEKSDMAYLK